MAPRMIVIGLGPGQPDHLTREAWDLLEGARVLYLRTARHPIVAHLPDHLELRPLDECYEAGRTFDQVYEAIVSRLLAAPERPLLYAVPGHPLVAEATTRLLLRRLGKTDVRIVAGLSFLEPVCTALGLDPLERGLQLYDALELAASDSPFVPPTPLDPTRDLLVAQLYDRMTASAVKLALMEHYPDEHPVKVVRAAGVPNRESVWEGPLYELDRNEVLDHLCTLYVPPLPRLLARRESATLEWLCARLRGPDGCPWDREQSHATLRNHLLEECYEALEALDQGDMGRLREELGDLLVQIYLHAQMAREEGAFSLGDVFENIISKLIRRHPHVFASLEVSGSAEVLRNWEAIKASERAEEGQEEASLLDGLPSTLPALAQAQAIGRRVARIGFDWNRPEEVWAKVEEEMAELRRATTPQERAEELGDLLFVLTNLARWLGIEAEDALRTANAKFRRRFAHLEAEARRRHIPVEQLTMAEMDALWEEAKTVER
ncbi:MAG: nucleoside triphosphate pyrophosphohydrolase [Chloroflexia bacterium]